MSSPFSQACAIDRSQPDRRVLLGGAASVLTLIALGPSRADTSDLPQAIRAFTGGIEPKNGKVTLDIAPLVENGNAVGVEVSVDHPMQAGNFVREIAIFSEKNPQPDVAIFHLTPRAGRAHAVTRMRLATTQEVVALARLSDGSCWIDRREVIVTIAACTED
jgi:sulfur-oxidizing protein SoxY